MCARDPAFVFGKSRPRSQRAAVETQRQIHIDVSGGKNDQHYSSRSRVLLRPGASLQGVQGCSCPPSPWLHCNSLLAAQGERLVIPHGAAELQELTYKIGKFEFVYYCMVRFRERFFVLEWGGRGGARGRKYGILLGAQTQSHVYRNEIQNHHSN